MVEQTGYPPEVVELDADLEADLGIDSIKKAQLFGELHEYFDVTPAEDLTLDDFPTLRHVMDFLANSGLKKNSIANAGGAASVAECRLHPLRLSRQQRPLRPWHRRRQPHLRLAPQMRRAPASQSAWPVGASIARRSARCCIDWPTRPTVRRRRVQNRRFPEMNLKNCAASPRVSAFRRAA